MSYRSVHSIYKSFGIGRIAYYRPTRAALDPTEDESSACARVYSGASKIPLKGEIRDAILESALRSRIR